MGRAKIDIKRIEDKTNRQVTFCKRRMGLMKKAQELAILCDADVAVLVVSSYGRVHSYGSSKDMERVLQNAARHKLRCTVSDGGNGNADADTANVSSVVQENIRTKGMTYERELDQQFRRELEDLHKELRIRDGSLEELKRLSYKEIVELERKMERALHDIKKQRIETCYKQLDMVKKKQKLLEMENNELRKHINMTIFQHDHGVDIFNACTTSLSSTRSSPLLESDSVKSNKDLHEESLSESDDCDSRDSNASLIQLRLFTG